MGRTDGDAGRGVLAHPRASTIIGAHGKLIGSSVAIVVVTIAAHLFSPTDWPPLGVDVLHSLHGPGFAVLSLALYFFLRRRCRSNINYFLAAGVTMAVGVVAEIAQIPGPRNAQFRDLFIDGLGVIGALGMTAAFDKRARTALRPWARIVLPVAAGIALSIACLPSVWYGYALFQQQRQFPVLLRFEAAWEQATLSRKNGAQLIVKPNPPGWLDAGRYVAHSEEKGRWGIFLSLHPLPDWRGYSQLAFTAASASNTDFPMTVCIRDSKPDEEARAGRYCKDVVLDTQAKEFTLAFSEMNSDVLNKAFDFSRVSSVVFSAAKPGAERSIWIDNVRLK